MTSLDSLTTMNALQENTKTSSFKSTVDTSYNFKRQEFDQSQLVVKDRDANLYSSKLVQAESGASLSTQCDSKKSLKLARRTVESIKKSIFKSIFQGDIELLKNQAYQLEQIIQRNQPNISGHNQSLRSNLAPEHFNNTSKSQEDYGQNVPLLKDLALNKYGWSALNAACYFGRLDIIKYLIDEHRSDPNQRNLNGWHSLIFTIMGSAVQDNQISSSDDQQASIGDVEQDSSISHIDDNESVTESLIPTPPVEQILSFLINETPVNVSHQDESGNNASYYAKKIYNRTRFIHGQKIIQLLQQNKLQKYEQ